MNNSIKNDNNNNNEALIITELFLEIWFQFESRKNGAILL